VDYHKNIFTIYRESFKVISEYFAAVSLDSSVLPRKGRRRKYNAEGTA
jgi:hypothetical protein